MGSIERDASPKVEAWIETQVREDRRKPLRSLPALGAWICGLLRFMQFLHVDLSWLYFAMSFPLLTGPILWEGYPSIVGAWISFACCNCTLRLLFSS